MPIIDTQEFWNYVVDEPRSVIYMIKDTLTFKNYNFDKKTYDIIPFYQVISTYCEDTILRYPAGLTKYLRDKLNLSIEYKSRDFHNYTQKEVLKTAEIVHNINPEFEIRDYQITAALSSLNRFSSLIHSSVGSGKSSVMCLVCKVLENDRILIMNGNNFILQQIYDRLLSFGITDVSWNPSKEPDYTKRIVLINNSSSDSRLNSKNEDYITFLKEVNTVIHDECFSKDTEILTASGYIPFNKLTGNELFANFDPETKQITFTPGQLIKKLPSSQCMCWKTNRKANIILTAKHQQLYTNTKTNKIYKKAIQDISFINKNNKIFCSGEGIGNKKHLTTLDKILIAIQADGCATQKANRQCYHIGFTKARKIQYWKELLKDFNGEVVQLKSQFKRGKELQRWHIWLPEYPNAKAKLLSDCFNLQDFSKEAAEEFLQEIHNWDGWQQSKYVQGYISTDKRNTDFVAAVGILAGYEVYQNNKADKRKNHSNWYRVFLRKKQLKALQNCKIKPINYTDYVYCVEVPTHNIIVRNGGEDQYSFISGNCQHIQSLTAFEPIFYMDPDKLRHFIGYSGSPFRNAEKPYKNLDDFVTIALLGEPAFDYAMADTIADGNIAQPYSYFINFPNRPGFVPEQFKESYFMQYRANITYNKARNNAGMEMLKFLNKNNIKTFASFNNIKPGQNMLKTLKEHGVNGLFICGDSTIYEWVPNKRGNLKLETRSGTPDDIRKALHSGYNIVIGSTVLDEGVDLSEFQAAVLFSAGKTCISNIQRIGRASRKRKEGANISFVIDFKDVGGYYIFEEHYTKRKAMMNKCGVKNIDKVQDFIKMIEDLGKTDEKDKP